MSLSNGILRWALDDRGKSSDLGEIYKRKNGSVLIIILWILMIIGFLAGEFLSHNRNKANLALNAMEQLNRRSIVDSFFQLYNSPGWKIINAGNKSSNWIGLTLGSMEFFVKTDKEKTRININTADDITIRKKIKEIYLNYMDTQNTITSGTDSDASDTILTDYEKKADELTDAVLDWRDKDDLVRLNGAEKDYYIDLKKPFIPANGRFKKITELLMVKGMNRTLFNGKLKKNWQDSDSYDDENSDTITSSGTTSKGNTSEMKSFDDKIPEGGKSFLNAFTIYPESYKRISIRIPSENNHVYSEVFIFNKNMKKQEHIYCFYYGE